MSSLPSPNPMQPVPWWRRLFYWPVQVTGEEAPALADRRRTACAIGCWEVLAFQIALIMSTGDIITAFALHLNFSPQWLGLLGVLPAAAAMLHPVGAWAVERLGRKKPFHLWLVTIARIAFFLPVLAYRFWPEEFQRPIVFVGLVIANALMAIATNAWQAWMGDLSDGILRGRYFGIRYALSAVATLVMGPILLIELGNAPTDTDFQRLFIWCLIASVLSLLLMGIQGEIPPPRSANEPGIRTALQALLNEKNVRRLLAWRMVHDFGVHLAAPFWLVYHRDAVQLSYATIAGFSITANLFAILGYLFWGRVADRMGHKPVVILGILGAGLTPLFWYTYAPSTWLTMYPEAAMSGLFWSGVNAQSYTMLVANSPARGRTHLLALISAGSGIAALIGGAAGGALAEATQNWRWAFGPASWGFALIGLHLNFTLSMLFRLGSVILLRDFHEEGAMSAQGLLQLLLTPEGWRQLQARARQPDDHTTALGVTTAAES